MMIERWSPLALVLAALLACLNASAHAGEVLDAVKARGELRCGVSEGIAGFSEQDSSGQWRGLDADFCRAVAAAVLGDPNKAKFLPLKASARFPALLSRKVDLLVRNTTWTLTREALLKLQFPGVLFYDGQGFLVAKSSGISAIADLNGATVCVEKGTTHEQNLVDYFVARGLAGKPLVIDSSAGVAEAFFAGQCRAYSSDSAQLAAVLARSTGAVKNFVILKERISKEPLGPVVQGGDAEWVTLVRWVLFVLIAAEEQGVTRGNIDAVLQKSQGAAWRLVSGKDERLARALGVRSDWIVHAIKAVGNYGEMYERNLGKDSPLNLERGLNRLWTEGGILYAPPVN
jgi:general L-amino acid transport system substrate-binding protein